MRRLAFLALLASTASLAGCTGSSRMDSFWGGSRSDSVFARQTAAQPGSDDIIAPTPSARPNGGIQTTDLAPVPGTRVAPADQVGIGGSEPLPGVNNQSIIAPDPAVPAAPPAVASVTPSTITGSTSPAVSGGGVSRLSGTWTVTDAGDKCRITLTSQSLFEYYRASASSCKSASFAKVNAWEQRGQEVVLLEPGGKVAARFFPQGDGRYSGSTARGASVIMSR